jgi:hypothetical protein
MTRRKPWGLVEPYGESIERTLQWLIQGGEIVWFWR